MRFYKLGAAITAALISSSTAAAANWERVGTSKDDTVVVYVDKQRIYRSQDNTLFWVRFAMTDQTHYTILVSARCGSHTFKTMKGSFFDRNGNPSDLTPDTDWQIATPDTLNDMAISYVCPAE